jgi:hypothetical protein
MVQVAKGTFIIDENGNLTGVILNIETYRNMLSLIQERVDRKDSKLFSHPNILERLFRKD